MPRPAEKSPINEAKFESLYHTTSLGYLLLAISAGLYALEEYIGVSRGKENFTIFFIHYFLAIVFVIILISNGAYGIVRSWRDKHLQKTIILLNLFLISAYALNRELPVFENSVPWFCVFLVLMSVVMLSYNYFDRLPKAVNCIQHALLGSALVLYLYMTIFVGNFYLLGAVGMLLLGIGTHVFVPIMLFFSAIRLMITAREKGRVGSLWVILGATMTILFVVSFLTEWNSRVEAIDRLANQSVIHADTELPVWVKVAQSLDNDWVTERILKSKLIYTVSNNHFHGEFFSVGNRIWDEERKHDPLVFMATGVSNSPLSNEDRTNILKALTNDRHRAQERLWSGDNLSTSYIVTDVDIYPELRLAYSEQYLTISNNSQSNNRWRGGTQEAIYTFQLPEGSVVTSLSLWVNGKEEKAILTSKQKATEAYTTIVGVEMRDPSVVHWQEGNTVSVRVFPCTPEEQRKVKIGITSPLPVVDGQILYQNVSFEGPSASAATQTSRIRLIGNASNVQVPNYFKKNHKGEYIGEGEYNPDLVIAMDASPIMSNQFSFDGFTYCLSDLRPTMSKVDFTNIYLDLNNSWTSDEVRSLNVLMKDYNVYTYLEGDFILMSAENWSGMTEELLAGNFSLFPFHYISDTEKSLVVTKGDRLSPYLRDFKVSAFAEGIGNFFASGKKVYLFNLEGGISTYVRSLRELRAFHFSQGNTDGILSLLKSKTFPLTAESDARIALHESNMLIERKVHNEKNVADNAPDHLARLFTYNDIMRQVGVNFFKDDFVNEKLVDAAAMAYVVSPVSSLIVLESREDYERFGIKDKDNSLQNATKNSSGAVPEPHEWALIIVFLLFIAFQILRNLNTGFRLVKK